MTRYRDALPQLAGRTFLTDGGLETTLVFLDGLDLPHFAAFDLLRTDEGRARLARYYDTYATLAARHGAGLVLETPTWRANPDWGGKLGYTAETLRAANADAVELLEATRTRHEQPGAPMVISGCLGPRGDGYVIDDAMTAEDAERYHAPQIEAFADTAADMVAAITMTYVEEAIGIARAARDAGMPVAISFTVETDGRLPSGQGLGEAVEAVDAATDAAPAYYMVNCAHPTHFTPVLDAEAGWARRIGGMRPNASRMSHAELDAATELDIGDPDELGRLCAELRERLPALTVLGGCCGTDERHIESIARACAPEREGDRAT